VPGVGLLLLRAAVGGTAILQGARHLSDSANLTLWMSVVALLSICGGISVLGGFLTPVGTATAVSAIVMLPSRYHSSSDLNAFDAALPAALVVIVAVAVVCLGPGAFSIDAGLFGRREIIIPTVSRACTEKE
jgi:uncharacterized membrane protein YphA (DoxX/SURF4 family)